MLDERLDIVISARIDTAIVTILRTDLVFA